MNNKYKKKPNGGLKRVTSHTGEFNRELNILHLSSIDF